MLAPSFSTALTSGARKINCTLYLKAQRDKDWKIFRNTEQQDLNIIERNMEESNTYKSSITSLQSRESI